VQYRKSHIYVLKIHSLKAISRIKLTNSMALTLKGCGDGRAVLRSTIREYLASEALHHLGVPTTRALAMTSSDEPVFRETRETAAVLVRMAPSFVRFGSFELFHYRGRPDALTLLADYTIDRWYPESGAGDDRYAGFFEAVVARTAELMAAWQAVGFAHGVMNTDNFSILGLTLDYGPYGFLDAYEPGFICNHTDSGGRYAFDRQPTIGLWNCYALANALTTLIDKHALESALETFETRYRTAFVRRMRAKLGLELERDDDPDLMLELLRLLEEETGIASDLSAHCRVRESRCHDRQCDGATVARASFRSGSQATVLRTRQSVVILVIELF